MSSKRSFFSNNPLVLFDKESQDGEEYADVQERYVYGRRILERAMDYGKLASRWNAAKSQTLGDGNGYGLVRYIGERTRMYIIDWSIESRVMHHHRAFPVVVDSVKSQDCTKSRSRIKVPERSTAAVRFRFRSDLGYPILFILMIIQSERCDCLYILPTIALLDYSLTRLMEVEWERLES